MPVHPRNSCIFGLESVVTTSNNSNDVLSSSPKASANLVGELSAIRDMNHLDGALGGCVEGFDRYNFTHAISRGQEFCLCEDGLENCSLLN